MKKFYLLITFIIAVINSYSQNWTWMKGSSAASGTAVYGTKGTEAAANTPGARRNAATFKDASGNIWIFGGINGSNNLNDLWRFNVTTNNWTWMSGANTANSIGSTTGTIEPSARNGCGYTVDANGDFYIYGGQGRNATFTNDVVYLYDIFKYTVSTGLWSNISEGNLGNTPSINTTNTSGYFWPCLWATSTHLYAFAGNFTIGTNAFTNRMHKYNFATNTWSSVSAGTTAMGTYNGVGTAGYPSARYLQSYWTDNAGNFWMFGGFGRGTNMTVPNVNLSLNDLWQFNPTTETWTQINSDNNSASTGSYGTINVAAATNRPVNMTGATVAPISSNTFLLFGGTSSSAYYNHSWTFNTITNQWTWVGGVGGPSNTDGTYGTQGTANSTNIPGGIESHTAVVSGNNYYIFGGNGYGSSGTFGLKNTLMRFDATALIAANVVAVPTITNTFSLNNIFSTTARVNYTLNANNANTTSSIAYGTSSNALNQTASGFTASGSSNTTSFATLTGLQPNTTYFYQVNATNAVGNATPSTVQQFTTLPPAPSLTVATPTNITFSSATLNYTVNANGTNSFVNIRYGTTSGNLTTQVSGSNTITGSTNTPLTKDLFSLNANTTYYYRIYAINTNSDSTVSAELSFTTLAPPQQVPVISNVTSNTITNNSAFINYTVNANGAATTSVIRYGTSSTNLNLSATGSQFTGTTNTIGSVQLTGLALGTQYFYRVEATNSGGNATPSATASFTTLNVVLNAPTNGLVAYYSFNNSLASHNGNHNMSSTVAATYGTGKVGNGVVFSNGVNSTLFNNTLTNDLPSTGPFTISFWKKNNLQIATPAFPTFFEMFGSVFVRLQSSSSYSSLERGYAYTAPPTVPLFAPAFVAETDGGVNAGSSNWEHYTLVHNPGGTSDPNRKNLVLYYNGVLRFELNAGTAFNIHKFVNAFTIGGGVDGSGNLMASKRFDGTIDEFYVYNRVLTQSEIVSVKDEVNAQLLPATIQSFNGKITNQTSTLNWQTTNEINVSHFDVEYSSNGTNFSKVAMQNAQNNSSNSYSVTHALNIAGKHFYRLKMIDKDGKYTYSQIINLQKKLDKGLQLQVLGNQIASNMVLNITTEKATNAAVIIRNAGGQVLQQSTKQALVTGTNSFSYNVANYAAGIYFIELVTDANERITAKFVKQ